MRYPKPPLLPGHSSNFNVGQTRFHKSHHLEFIAPGVPYISEIARPGIGGIPLEVSQSTTKPSVYALGEIVKLPPWIVFDKHVLAFDAYYLQGAEGVSEYSVIVHKCKIYFFLEDGTIKVVEQKNPLHDGLQSGCIINRQRIRYPAEGTDDFYDILDFNIGYNIELFGKVFKIVDCDVFTRKFLNRLGICVPDPIETPEDPFSQMVKVKKMKPALPHRLNKKITLDEFLSDDNRKLAFYAYWDDRENENGLVHLLTVIYYLTDDTIEIKDVTDKENTINILRRGKLPMDVHHQFEGPGSNEPFTVLNAIGPAGQMPRYIVDPLDIGRDHRPCYTDKDMRIGTVITAFGRKIVIYDCDDFTKEYYKEKYGIERQLPLDRPPTKEEELLKLERKIEFAIPPYNGFGTYEDSLENCLKFRLEGNVKPYKQFLEKDKIGYDSRILRFLAVLVIKNQPTSRIFVISYYLKDDTISVYEMTQSNSGARGGFFIGKRQIKKPGKKDKLLTKPPEYFTFNDLYIGNIVCFDEFDFEILSSDEYSLRYMETHPNEFPLSNIQIITKKVKDAVKPIYKHFVAKFLEADKFPPAPFKKFQEAIKAVMGDKITQHEILILARFYAVSDPQELYTLETLRRYAHDELRKHFFNDFERLKECFFHYDQKKCGFVSKSDAYKILRGCRLPLDVELIRVILEKFGKGESCDIVYEELISFLNYNCEPLSKHIEPINIAAAMAWLEMCKPQQKSTVSHVDVDRLTRDFDLEKNIQNQCK